MIKFNELKYDEKLACVSLFPEESKKDIDRDIRLEAYRALGYTEEAKNDSSWYIRQEAYRAFGYTEEAKNDKDMDIRKEAGLYLYIKNQLEKETIEEKTTEEQTIQLNGKMYKLTEIIK